MTQNRLLSRGLGLLLLTLWTTCSLAHRPSDSFIELELSEQSASLQWAIALQDLVLAIELDSNTDGQLQWGELNSQQHLVVAMAQRELQLLSADSPCTGEFAPLQLIDRDGLRHAFLQAQYDCAATHLQYQFLHELDRSHRGILRVQHSTQDSPQLRLLQPGVDRVELKPDAHGAWQTFLDYVVEGVHHIWIGLDHILFLLSLLIPSVLRPAERGWQPVTALKPALLGVAGTVTAFTLAHSITLSAAVLQWLSLPIVWVETLIAASVVFAAINNITGWVRQRIWILAFSFGLIHGFGFAAVLGELGLPTDLRVLSLLAFNLGVELGQLAIVVAVVPLFYLLRHSWLYRSGIRIGGSLAVAALASGWLWERWPRG